MTEWRSLIRQPLVELGAYVPGVSAEDVRRHYDLTEVIRLNWNEGLFGPLPGVLDAVAETLGDTWAYPESAYRELRERLAARFGVDVDQIVPGHGIQALLLTLVSVFVEPGDRVVVPHPTYSLYAQACQAAGAQVKRVPCRELALDLGRIAAVARARRARRCSSATRITPRACGSAPRSAGRGVRESCSCPADRGTPGAHP